MRWCAASLTQGYTSRTFATLTAREEPSVPAARFPRARPRRSIWQLCSLSSATLTALAISTAPALRAGRRYALLEHLLFADDTLWMTLMEGAWKATAPEECFAVRVHPASYGHRAILGRGPQGNGSLYHIPSPLGRAGSGICESARRTCSRLFPEMVQLPAYHNLVEACNENRRMDPDELDC